MRTLLHLQDFESSMEWRMFRLTCIVFYTYKSNATIYLPRSVIGQFLEYICS